MDMPISVFRFKHSELFQHYAAKASEVGKGVYSGLPEDPPETPEPEQSEQVYRTETGKKYHLAGCSSLRKSKIPISLADAKLRYEPCRRCNPPQ